MCEAVELLLAFQDELFTATGAGEHALEIAAQGFGCNLCAILD